MRALAEVEVGRGEKDLRCKSLFIVCQRRRDYQKMKRRNSVSLDARIRL